MDISFRLDGKVALVTGAGSGIGKVTAMALAEAGADVAITELSNRLETAEETAQNVRALGRRAAVVSLNQTKLAEIKAAIETIVGSLGRLDILVNNAGLGIKKPALEFSEEEWDLVLETDLKGAFFCAQEAAKQMIKQGNGGRIVNVASAMGFQANSLPGSIAYCAAKAGLVNTTKVLAVEWAQHRIVVNAIAPGYVETPMLQNRFADNPDASNELNKMISQLPARRLAKPEEIASTIVFLASPAASYVVGHTLIIDGGWTIW